MTPAEQQYAWDEEHVARQAVQRARLAIAAPRTRSLAQGAALIALTLALELLALPVLGAVLTRLAA